MMGDAFPEAEIESYSTLIPSLDLPDKNDRHVLAAAIKADAQHIVTENLIDFPEEALEPWGIEAIGADQFLESTFELYPQSATSVMARMRRDYKKPAYDREAFLLELTRAGMPRLSSQLKAWIDVL